MICDCAQGRTHVPNWLLWVRLALKTLSGMPASDCRDVNRLGRSQMGAWGIAVSSEGRPVERQGRIIQHPACLACLCTGKALSFMARQTYSMHPLANEGLELNTCWETSL